MRTRHQLEDEDQRYHQLSIKIGEENEHFGTIIATGGTLKRAIKLGT